MIVDTQPGDRRGLPFRVGSCNDPLTASLHPAVPDNITTNGVLEQALIPFGDEVSPSSGTFSATFRVLDATDQPMSEVLVSLYDRDQVVDDFIESKRADANGYVSFSVPCDQDINGGHIDPRLRIETEGTHWVLRDQNLYLYVSIHDYQDNACGGYGTTVVRPPAALTTPWMFYAEAAQSYYFAAVFGVESKRLSIQYPYVGDRSFYLANENAMYLAASAGVFTLHHEFGHYVDDIARGDVGDLPGPGGPHQACVGIQHVGLALTEGWATFWGTLFTNHDGSSCGGAYGEQNEGDVTHALIDMCDQQTMCNDADVDTCDPVSEADMLGTSKLAIEALPSKYSAWKNKLLNWGRTRAYTVGAVENGMPLNSAPTLGGFTSPSTNAWQGTSATTGVYASDPDTWNKQVTFWFKYGGGNCLDPVTKQGLGQSHYSTAYTFPSGIHVKDGHICARAQDELGANSPMKYHGPIWVDSKMPTSSGSVDHPLLSTTWTVSWSASDSGGSGIRYVRIYEQDPGTTTWELIHTSSSASDSIEQSREIGDNFGVYCYRSVAEDRKGNFELSTSAADSCSNPV